MMKQLPRYHVGFQYKSLLSWILTSMWVDNAILLNLGCLTRLMPAVKSIDSVNRDTVSPFSGSVHSMAGNCWKLYLMRSRMNISNSARSNGFPLCYICLASHSSQLIELICVFLSINFIFSFQITNHNALRLVATFATPLHKLSWEFLPVPK